MGEVVRSVTLKSFNPAKYPNPALQWHYRILQAIALEEELPEQPEDKTIPKYNAIHKRTGPLALESGELRDQDVVLLVEPLNLAPVRRERQLRMAARIGGRRRRTRRLRRRRRSFPLPQISWSPFMSRAI